MAIIIWEPLGGCLDSLLALAKSCTYYLLEGPSSARLSAAAMVITSYSCHICPGSIKLYLHIAREKRSFGMVLARVHAATTPSNSVRAAGTARGEDGLPKLIALCDAP